VRLNYAALAGLVNATLMMALFTVVSPCVAAQGKTVLMIGDSLTAGLGLPRAQSIPERLEVALQAAGLAARIINAGVSGDTTAGGRARIGWALSEKPDAVILELGANDGLRGLDPKATYENLDVIIAKIIRSGARVLLTGMKAPPNLGTEYGGEFNQIFPRLAAKHRIALMPFFLDGVAGIAELNQDDAIHPNEHGVSIVVGNLLPYVTRLLQEGPHE